MSQPDNDFALDQAKAIRSTALAVYTRSRNQVTIGRLMADAESAGYSLSFTGLGLSLREFMDQPEELQASNLKTLASGIIVAFNETQMKLKNAFEEMYLVREKALLAKLLNTGVVPWCEFYFSKFQFEELNSKTLASVKSKIMESIPKECHPAFKKTTSRYAFINNRGRKEGQDLIRMLAVSACEQTNGILAYHKHWLRYSRGDK